MTAIVIMDVKTTEIKQDKTSEINGVIQRCFFREQNTMPTEKAGMIPNTDIFHQFILTTLSLSFFIIKQSQYRKNQAS